MHGTRTHHQEGRNRGTYPASPPTVAPMFYGWSPQTGRMEMMDLPDYLDSMRQGYDRAIQDLQQQFATVTQAYLPAPTRPGPGTRRGHQHPKHRRSDHECGDRDDHRCREDSDCDDDDDCRCECCIGDADIVVYSRCGEVRVIPIALDNDTRKVREDVALDVSDVRSAGGRILPWDVSLLPEGRLNLEPCSTTHLQLVVRVHCEDANIPVVLKPPEGSPGRGAKSQPASAPAEKVLPYRPAGKDVDSCEVGYVTIRVGGCLIRPVVVAIAVLPRDCGAYRAGCACAGCC